MYDDDKGRGSYKCGRCGVPKKGHVCPYQPKVKRRPEDPAPEMKCVSTQVEMDEFMTLRRLNLEIQGFPESYAAEPMNMVGAEVHPHPSQVLVGGVNSAPSYSAPASHPGGRGPSEQGHPSGVPSLASMSSHPHPPAYPHAQAAPYSHPPAIPPPHSVPETTPKSEHSEPKALKTEESSAPEETTDCATEPSEPKEAPKGVEITTQTETKSPPAATDVEITSQTETKPSLTSADVEITTQTETKPPPPAEEEVTKSDKPEETQTDSAEIKDEVAPTSEEKKEAEEPNNGEEKSESNKRIKTE
jgi:hypothetical protein